VLQCNGSDLCLIFVVQDAAFDIVKSVAVGTKRLQRIAHKLQSLL
jgi:hypothetical protein